MEGRIVHWLMMIALGGCGGNPMSVPPVLPAWDKALPDARVLGTWRGLVPARGIVHLHSPYSHDACDGMPRDQTTKAVNEPCLADLRAALCNAHIDFAALTDHDDSMADEQFETLFSMRGPDRVVAGTGGQIASHMSCPDGHLVTFTIGGENDLMPIMLDRHVAGDAAQRHATYNGVDAAAVTAFRDAGGLVWVAHTESKTLPELRDVAPDGIEVYNLHANLDPEIRRDYLGLSPDGAIAAAAEFADTNPGHPEPDLALLGFLSANQPAITTWNTLLGEGRKVATTAGSDAHQNAIPILLGDGERGDSYRRVLRWFGNIAYVSDPHDPVAVKQALRDGRMFALMELLGTPEGLDIHATASGQTIELGGTLPPGATIEVTVPNVRNLDPALPEPIVRARVLRIAVPGGAVSELASVEGAGQQLTVPTAGPGAYRVELAIVPRHLGPYLGDLGPKLADVELPWVYASPFYLE